MGKVVVVGSTNTDMVVTSTKMPLPGETVLGNEFDVIPGGKGANQAVAASRAGSQVSFVGKVGNDDFGRKTRLEFVGNKISTKNIAVDPDKPSGVALIIVDEQTGQNSIVVASGANGNLTCEDVKNAEDDIKSADVLLVQLEIPIETVQYALELAKKHGVLTVLNPAPAQALSNEMLSLVDVITPNESETEILIGIKLSDDNDTKKAANALLQKVNMAVIITLGSKGVYYTDKDGVSDFIAAKKVKAVDTTAAGDVFNGYLAAVLATTVDLKSAILLANKAAAFSVSRKGAQPSIPRAEEL